VRTWFFIIVIGLSVHCCASEQALATNAKADRVVVVKKDRTLTLLSHGNVIKTYKVRS
jgi:hypothetical protein